MWVKPFNELSKDHAHIAGGKGASLGELTGNGIPVPQGFVVLADAFSHFVEVTGLKEAIQSSLNSVDVHDTKSVETASQKIQAMILDTSYEMPPDTQENIVRAFAGLGAEFVAVRSSATAEDSAEAAWAGQLDTYLNTTERTLLPNVRRCWASLFTPRAIFYRFEKKLDQTAIAVAVVVQKMVDSAVSGVAFSVDPVTEDRNHILIEAALGLGEAVVSGQITPDSYVLSKNPFSIVEKTTAHQEKGLYRKQDGDNEWRAMTENEGEAQKLSDDQIVALGEIIVHIENHYGTPQDIEWAYENDDFYILQSRPITTLS